MVATRGQPQAVLTKIMAATLSEALRDAGRDIASTQAPDVAARLNSSLGSAMPAFYVGPGTIVDLDGARSDAFDLLISVEPPAADGTLRSDAVACAAYVCETLDAASLAEAYSRLAKVRRLRKTPSTEDLRSTITLGLIVAANSALSLDDVAAEMRALNKTVVDGERPDMVAVLASGTVNYGMSFPGDESVGGFLSPSQGGKIIPPINVRQIVTETPTHALNKVCGFVIGHTAFFAPSVSRPDMRAATEGCPEKCAIVWTYRYDPAGKLVDAVTSQDSTAPAYRVEDPQGALLSRLAFQPWQNGGIVLAEGSLPLEGLLPLAGRGFPATAFRMKNGHQISCVLPLDDRGFVELSAFFDRFMIAATHADVKAPA